MNKKRISLAFSHLTVLLLAFFLAALLFSGCAEEEKPVPGRVTAATTIPPLAYFIERIGGDRVEVFILVPPGANPHTHEPSPGALAKLAGADLYFAVGSGIEFELAWMEKITRTNPSMTVVNCSSDLTIENGDPHTWLSPENAMAMGDTICESLIRQDPEGEEFYLAGRDALKGDLAGLDETLIRTFAEEKGMIIISAHDSWGYLAREYHFTQLALEQEGKEATPQHLASIIDLARSRGITTVFAEPQFSTRSAEAVAEEIGGRVVSVDPLAEDYIENMKAVSTAFAESWTP